MRLLFHAHFWFVFAASGSVARLCSAACTLAVFTVAQYQLKYAAAAATPKPLILPISALKKALGALSSTTLSRRSSAIFQRCNSVWCGLRWAGHGRALSALIRFTTVRNAACVPFVSLGCKTCSCSYRHGAAVWLSCFDHIRIQFFTSRRLHVACSGVYSAPQRDKKPARTCAAYCSRCTMTLSVMPRSATRSARGEDMKMITRRNSGVRCKYHAMCM